MATRYGKDASGVALASVVTLALALVAATGHAAAVAEEIGPNEPAVVCQDDSAAPEVRLAACATVAAETTRPAPERVEALLTRAGLNDDAGRWDAAMADLDAALALEPRDAAALILRGNVHLARGDIEKARADYEAAIAAEPTDPAGYFNRGVVHEAKGATDAAVADYRKALALDPSFDEAAAALRELVPGR